MSDQIHRGARPSQPFGRDADPRVLQLDELMRTAEVGSGALPAQGLFKDALRSRQGFRYALGKSGQQVVGTVIHAIPSTGWYKVQVSGLCAWIGACRLNDTSLMPLGPRDIDSIRPNDSVLLWLPPGVDYGIILGVIPPTILQPGVSRPDWISQGGGSGLLREQAHLFPVTQTYKKGGVRNWSNWQPLDATGFERGWISPTGAGVMSDDFLVQVRVNEMCGLFLFLFDSLTRLAGVNLDIESAVHTESVRDDEGEASYSFRVATYPWEALGLYAAGTAFTKTNESKDVQYTLHEAEIEPIHLDLQPIERCQFWGGYIGQGGFRSVSVPTKSSGMRRFSDTEADVGLFREQIGLNGAYSLVSAKSVHIGKRCIITQPKQLRKPEDPQGDDAEADNYKFSGQFGGGDEHKVKDLTVTGAKPKSMLRVAGIMDIVAYEQNWQGLHPFHYHKADYLTEQEGSNSGPFNSVQEVLDFSVLATQPYMEDPEPKKLKIDHRYGEVDFYQRESFMRLHDDGSVHIGCGFGAEIVLAGGRIRLTAPGGIDLLSGADIVQFADQIVLRAKGSIDVSSTDKDVRLKAHRNLQALADEGGILLESNSEDTTQDYDKKFGEDVVSSGIVLRASDSQVVGLASEIYLRTLDSGALVLDAGQGLGGIQLYSSGLDAFVTSAVRFIYGPQEDNSDVDFVYLFSPSGMIVDTQLLVGGNIIGYGGCNITVDGAINAIGSIASGGKMADKTGNMLAKVPDGFTDLIETSTDAAADQADKLKDGAQETHEQQIVEHFYQDDQIGGETAIRTIHFSFRDPPGGNQYHVDGLIWVESRWQMMARLGLGSGGQTWDERPVHYQGEDTYPYPGKQKWKEEPIYFTVGEPKMFDVGTGCAKDRPGPYEDPQLADWEPKTMSDEYKLIR